MPARGDARDGPAVGCDMEWLGSGSGAMNGCGE